MPFLTLTAVFLFIGPVLIMGIATMWSNLKQKISDELSAHVIKILIDLGILNNIPEIGKRSLHDQIFTELNDKFDTCISDINSTFTAKLGRINNDLNNKLNKEVNAGFGKINTELNSKLTAEAEKNKARDDDFTREAQKIFSMVNNITTKVNNIEEACRNEFSRINVVIENLQNETNQHYAVVQRSDFDQQSVSNESEANSSPSSSSGSSNLSGIFDITGDIKIRFKQHFDRLMKARNYTFDEMCYSVAVDIRSLGGNIKISTVKNFYSGVGRSTVGTVNQINAWVASFNNNAE